MKVNLAHHALDAFGGVIDLGHVLPQDPAGYVLRGGGAGCCLANPWPRSSMTASKTAWSILAAASRVSTASGSTPRRRCANLGAAVMRRSVKMRCSPVSAELKKMSQ